ncbi:MAG: L-seryl-tRNA(Sec) selenium transferase [Planctomycetota bacterium]
MTEPDPRNAALRALPSVDRFLGSEVLAEISDRYPRASLKRAVRTVLDGLRGSILAGDRTDAPDDTVLAGLVVDALEGGVARGLRRVINATGVVAHTGLGRSVLPEDARRALWEETKSYCMLAIDRETTERADRHRFCEELITEITGAEAACVTNNNAAATLLMLHTWAKDREVIIARGQLVEIGGSFRIPDILRLGGARLVEVGCTNKVHLSDYEAAITDETGLLMRVHTSNYRIEGFAQEVPIARIASLGRERGIPVVDDLGAGAFLDLGPFGFPEEPVVMDSVRAGANMISMSADKLIGGPQGGIILGTKEHIHAIQKNQLYRAFRVGKLTLIALEATLRYFLDRRRALEEHPTTRMLTRPLDEIEAEARALADGLAGIPGVRATTIPAHSESGSGSYPGHPIPTFVAALAVDGIAPDDLSLRLRRRPIAVFTRVKEGRVRLDPRTMQDGEIAEAVEAVREIVAG